MTAGAAAGAAPSAISIPARTGRRQLGRRRTQLPPAPRSVGWQLAVVLRTEPEDAAIGLQGRPDRAHSVRRRCAGRGRCATTARSAPRRADAAECRQAGRSRAGRELSEEAARRRPTPKANAAKPNAGGPLYNLCQIPDVSGAVVAIDPHTGRVLAMSGGFSFEIEPVQPRHPGQAAARLVDQAVRLSDRARTRLHARRRWSTTRRSRSARARACRPGRRRNYSSNRFRGPTPLRVALEKSLNTVTARLADDDRHGGDRRRRSRNSASWTTCRGSTRWRSAPARRRRCATPRPMRCSPTAASASRRR